MQRRLKDSIEGLTKETAKARWWAFWGRWHGRNARDGARGVGFPSQSHITRHPCLFCPGGRAASPGSPPVGPHDSTPARVMVTLTGSRAAGAPGASGADLPLPRAALRRLVLVVHVAAGRRRAEQLVSLPPEVAGLPHAARLGVPDRRDRHAEQRGEPRLRQPCGAPARCERLRQRHPQRVRVVPPVPRRLATRSRAVGLTPCVSVPSVTSVRSAFRHVSVPNPVSLASAAADGTGHPG